MIKNVKFMYSLLQQIRYFLYNYYRLVHIKGGYFE